MNCIITELYNFLFYILVLCILRFETEANIIEFYQNLCFIQWESICARCTSCYATRLTFVGPCIVMYTYFYSKTNQMHSISFTRGI